ncbi:MAG: hypothetical protein GXZ07_09060 [Firmicutes bacterium]|nr:hypothetical protein [Bacillota bacterium]
MNNRCIKGRSQAIIFLFLLALFVSVAFWQNVRCFAESNHNVNTAVSGDSYQEKESLSCSFILLTLDKITFKDLLQYSGPLLSSLLRESSLGLMNVNTAGSLGTESGYLTIGSGARLLGNWTARKAYNREEKSLSVEVLYRRHSGKDQVPPGKVLHPYTGALELLNSSRPYPVLLGALGEALGGKGLSAAVLGNADTDQEGRQAVTIAMNNDGAVAYGDVSAALLKEDQLFPFGHRCNARAYLDAYKACREKASFIVVEWGDTGRINSYLGHLAAERRGELLESSFQELDLFLEGLLAEPGLKGRLLIAVPSPPQASVAGGYRLTPVVYYNPEDPQGGMLISKTTRVPGIVANIDIAPSVAEYFSLAPSVYFSGAPLETKPAAGHLQKVSAIAERTSRTYLQRSSIIKGYLLLLIILVVAGLVGVVTRFHPVRSLQPAFYGLLYFPLSFLLAPAFNFFPAESYLVNFCFLTVLTAVFVVLTGLFWRNPMAIFAVAGLLVFGFLAADLLGGAHLQSRSFLGYDPVGGARFYGIGNEYMGVMIGSFILGFGSLISLRLKGRGGGEERKHLGNFPEIRILVLLFAVLSVMILFLMASPDFGANFGGAVTAALSLSLTLGGFVALLYGGKPLARLSYLLSKKKKRLPVLALIFIPLLFFLLAGLLLYFLNLPRPDANVSHLGRTLELIQKEGFGELLNIVVRKLEMNYKLVRYSLWTRALLVMIALIAILYYYPFGMIKKIFAGEPGFRVAMGGIIAASVTAFLVNDSGVVAAATSMLYGGLPLLILALGSNFCKI